MTERLALFLFTVGLGVVIALHLAMNARAGEMLGSVRAGNFIFWMIGALTGCLIWLASADFAALGRAFQVPAGLWLAGVMGSSLVLGISFAMPRLGVGPTTVGLLLGQLAAGAVISHFGWLSPEAIPLNPVRLAGLGTIAAGVLLVVR